MIRADDAIARLRRDLTIGTILKATLITVLIASILLENLFTSQISFPLVLVLVVVVWLVLSYRSIKGSRLAAESPSLIASGQYDEAEESIDQALRSFSVFRSVKLSSLHHLAALRHAQRRWHETATLCRALLRERETGLGTSVRLVLADSLLEIGDVPGAYEALIWLYQRRLSLGQALQLLAIQLDYLWRVEAWSEMMAHPRQKAELTELMTADSSARCQALMALAAKKTGRSDWHEWLLRRAHLLVDPRELTDRRPVLRDLWPA